MKVALVQKTKRARSGDQPLYIRLSHGGRNAFVSLGLAVHPRDWNPRRSEVRGSHRDATELNELMQQRLADAQAAANAVLLEKGRGVTLREVKEAVVDVIHPSYDSEAPPLPIVPWMRAEVKRAYRDKGKVSTALAYGSVLTNLEEALREQGKRPKTLPASGLTLQVLTAYRDWLADPAGGGHAANYVHKQVTTVRALLRRAIREGVPGASEALEAAELVKVKREKPDRARLPIEEVRAYYAAELSGRAADVRDWWCFSFFGGGIRFGDVCRLRWTDVQRAPSEDGRGAPLSYKMRAQKTGAKTALPLSPEAAAILTRWEARTLDVPEERRSPFVFGLLDEADEADPARLRKAIGRKGAIARKYLRQRSEAEGWTERYGLIGFHSSRHSLADHMRKSGADIYSVSRVLGHTKISTTEQYLASFDEVTVGKALLDSLRDGHGDEG